MTNLTQTATVMQIQMMIGCMIWMIKVGEGNQVVYHLKQVLSRGQMHAIWDLFKRSIALI
jgi:hypothetical protein